MTTVTTALELHTSHNLSLAISFSLNFQKKAMTLLLENHLVALSLLKQYQNYMRQLAVKY